MTFDIKSLMFVGGVSLVVALTQICKKWVVDARWYPVISIGLGLLVNVPIGIMAGIDALSSVYMGIIAGLMASGIYSVTQTEEPPKPPA